jgi:hypothetical protein
MSGRMSNRDRIAHLRAEADAAAREKAEAKAAKAAKGPTPRASSRKAAAAPARVRIVWFVCDASGREVKRFPYSQEAEARAAAEQLSAASGRTHFVKQADVPAG